MSAEVLDPLALTQTQEQLSFKPHAIQAALLMLAEGNTVPFIARYRKERTGNLDEVQLREIEAKFTQNLNLNKRKADVIKLIDEQGKLTADLQRQLKQAANLQQVEDLYLPYKQKRKSKATIARARGLAPLAEEIRKQPARTEAQWQTEAEKYCQASDELETSADVWAGVHEILAEEVGDVATFRAWTRRFLWQHGELQTTVKDEELDEAGVYRLYYDFATPVAKLASHQILAINRAEKEKVIRVKLTADDAHLITRINQRVNTDHNEFAAKKVSDAVQDAYQRFIQPALVREIRAELKEKADQQAIQVFGNNLRHLLLQPPLKNKMVLGFDPAFRTGCKLAVVDGTGKYLDKLVIYPHHPAPAKKRAAAESQFIDFLQKYQIEMIAIGNGTASRESEKFVAQAINKIDRDIYYVIVNEAGASVYSASSNARAEFPDLQVEERSAISIARRLQDPLAELLKIDPKAVGVGQYQHDVKQKDLSEQLDVVVEDVVNQVGVNLNTASVDLLQHISGLSKTLSQNIVAYRNEHGRFQTRADLQQVPRLGPKTYQQAIGFLRIINGTEPLDNTDIHPESYAVAEAILRQVHANKHDLGTPALKLSLKMLIPEKLQQEFQVGEQTLKDIQAGLAKPGRDLRDQVPAPLLRQDVLAIEDLHEGMILQGTVRNVVDFGAFVDIGVKQDGLVHISQLADHFVKSASKEVAVGDIVKVKIIGIDLKRERIQLSMRGLDR